MKLMRKQTFGWADEMNQDDRNPQCHDKACCSSWTPELQEENTFKENLAVVTEKDH